MESLKDYFSQLCRQLEAGRGLSNSGDDPVYYLIIRPEIVLEAKAQEKAWRAQLQNKGWEVEVFSMADAVAEIVVAHPLHKIWLASPSNRSFDVESIQEVNDTVASALGDGDRLAKLLLARLDGLIGKARTALMITDLEALHPYLRVGVLEQKIQGRVSVPVIILYPGTREGTALSFLGIYPPDGNYRSVHFGG